MAVRSKFDNVRADVMEKVKELLENMENEVLRTASNELCIPIVNAEGEEGYLVMKFTIPQGARDGEPYDGYSVAESYALHLKTQAEKAKANSASKEKKIARDKKLREEKAKAKEA